MMVITPLGAALHVLAGPTRRTSCRKRTCEFLDGVARCVEKRPPRSSWKSSTELASRLDENMPAPSGRDEEPSRTWLAALARAAGTAGVEITGETERLQHPLFRTTAIAILRTAIACVRAQARRCRAHCAWGGGGFRSRVYVA